MPAQAGIQSFCFISLGSRFRGNDLTAYYPSRFNMTNC